MAPDRVQPPPGPYWRDVRGQAGGRIDNVFFDRKSAEWRTEQDHILHDIETHQSANRTYIEESVQLLRLADRAHALFERQKPAEKRHVLNFVFSNCVWKEGLLSAEYRQPFDMLALAPEAPGDQVGEDAAKTASFEKWLPSLNPLRSFSTAGLSLATPQPTG